MVPIQYNLRNLAVRKATTVASAAGLALVVFVFATAMMLSQGIKKTLSRSAANDVAVVLRKGSDAELASGIEDPTVQLVKASPFVAKSKDGAPMAVGEVVIVILLDKVGVDGQSNVEVRGVPDNVLAFRPEARIVEGRAATPGTDEVVVGKAIRGRFKGLELGQTFELRKNRPVKVVGIFEDGNSSYESEVWADLDTARNAFGREGVVSSVRVKLSDPGKFDAFKIAVDQDRQLGLEVMRETDYFDKQSSWMTIFVTTLGSIVAFFFSVGAMIGAMITMHASIANRTREIGTLRALGFSKGSILFSFLLESLLLALLGGAVGVLSALPMGFARFSTVNWQTWSEVAFTFEPTPGILLTAMLLACAMGLLGGFFPAVRAARVSPVQAMRG